MPGCSIIPAHVNYSPNVTRGTVLLSHTGYRCADIFTSVKNHLIGFAAERSRHNGTVEDMDAFMAEYGFENKY